MSGPVLDVIRTRCFRGLNDCQLIALKGAILVRLTELANGAPPHPHCHWSGICYDVERTIKDRDPLEYGHPNARFSYSDVSSFMCDVFSAMYGVEPGHMAYPLGEREFDAEGTHWYDKGQEADVPPIDGALGRGINHHYPRRGSNRRTLAGLAAAYLDLAALSIIPPESAL